MTGLPNRALLRQVQRCGSKCPRKGKSIAVYFLDLDNFKTINDTLGIPMATSFFKVGATEAQTEEKRYYVSLAVMSSYAPDKHKQCR